MTQSGIPDDLVTAYRSAHYRAGSGQGAITFCVDQHSEALSRLLAASGFRSAAFVTACNPLGVRDSMEANRLACARLRKKLACHVSRPDQIMDALKGHPLEAFDRSIDVHISRLRSKIDKGFTPPLLHTVRGAGYMIRE